MISVIPPGDKRDIVIIGKSQGYLGLAVHFGQVIDAATGAPAPQLTTAHQPTPKELEALNAGASIIIGLLNILHHPPILVQVGEIPLDAESIDD